MSWFDNRGMLRVDRVYLLDRLTDPAGLRLLDALSGKVLDVWAEQQPLFKPPTKPHAHRETLAKEWDRPVSPRRIHDLL